MLLKRIACIAAPVVIVVTAFIFRFYPNNSGIASYVFLRHDELHYVTQVIAFLNGDGSVDYFINPTLCAYVIYGATAIFGLISVISGQFASFDAFSMHTTFNPHLIFITGRFVSMVAGAGAVALIFCITKKLFSFRTALIAAAALALNATHLRRSVLAGNESLMLCVLLVFFLLLLYYLQNPSPKRHALCGFVLGLAGSVKYNAFILVLALIAASLISAFKDEGAGKRVGGSIRRAFLSPKYNLGYLFTAIGLFAGSPYILINFPAFFDEFFAQFSFLHEGFSATDIIQDTVGYCFYPMMFSEYNNGLAFSIFCGLGLLAAIYQVIRRRDPGSILLLSTIVPLYLFLGSGVFCRMRFFLPAIPFILILGAWAFEGAVRMIFSALKERGAALYSIVLALAFATLTPSAINNFNDMEKDFGSIDSRRDFVLWVKENIKPDDTVLFLSYPLRNEFPDSKGRVALYGYKEAWFDTTAKRAAFKEFKASLYDFTPLRDLLTKCKTLDELKDKIDIKKFDYLLLNMSTHGLINLERLPEKASDQSIRNCSFWKEFVGYIAGNTPIIPSASQDKEHTMVLIDLKL